MDPRIGSVKLRNAVRSRNKITQADTSMPVRATIPFLVSISRRFSMHDFGFLRHDEPLTHTVGKERHVFLLALLYRKIPLILCFFATQTNYKKQEDYRNEKVFSLERQELQRG